MSSKLLLEDSVFLIAGAFGFIAQAFIRTAEGCGGLVVGFDLKKTDRLSKTTVVGLDKIYVGSLESVSDSVIRKIVESKRSKVIAINFAGIASVSLCEKSPGIAYEANVHFSLSFARFAERIGASILIYPSTGYVYGDAIMKAHKETSPVFISSTYVCTKLATESLLKAFAFSSSYKIVIVRLSNVYGRGCSEDSVLGTIVKQAKEFKNIIVRSFQPIRDFIHVDDVARAILRIAAHEEEKKYTIYNISTAIPMSIGKLVKKASELWAIRYTEPEELEISDHVSYLVLDNSKAKDTLAWSPMVSINDGLVDIIKGEGNDEKA